MTDSQGRTRPAIVLAAQQVESSASSWQRLKEMLRRSLECQIGRPEVEVRVTADTWTLREGNDVQVLENVEGGIGLILQRPAAECRHSLHFRLGEQPGETARADANRSRPHCRTAGLRLRSRCSRWRAAAMRGNR